MADLRTHSSDRRSHATEDSSTRVARRASEAGVGPLAPPEPPRRGRRLLVTALVVVGALLVAGVGYTWWPRPATPISEQEALERFWADTGDDALSDAATAIPIGVYRYAATGEEEVTIGGFPLPARSVPELVTLAVHAEGDCMRVTLNLMAEHTETSTYCPGADGGLVLTGQTKFQQVAGFTTRGQTECTDGDLGSPGNGPHAVRCTLQLEVAGTTMVTELTGTARWEPATTVEVAGRDLMADPLHLDLTASGDFTGHWIERQWLDERGVPLRIERDIDLAGPGRFAETTTLVLLDPTPSR